MGRKQGIAVEKMLAVAGFERSELFDAVERLVLRYAEHMTRTPVEVPDALFADLKRHFNDAQIIELTATVALENLRARFNHALDIPSDNLCQLPLNNSPRSAAAAGA